MAGLIIWSVVTPQAVAYAQIAGLPPEAGLVAAPGAMLGYALVGGSRSLVVGATTSTAALSAATVGPLADGDAGRFAALSAAAALVAAAVFVAAGTLRLGGVTDLVSKPVITGFLFGLGISIAVGQLPKLLGVDDTDGNVFAQLADMVRELGDVHGPTVALGLASVVALVALRRVAPAVPGTLVVLAAAIAASALLGFDDHGIDVVGELPSALPDPALPDVSASDLTALLPVGLGVLILSTEAVGVARAYATSGGYAIDINRELTALGVSNLLAGASSGFVQSGGASQTAAAAGAGGRSQLASLVAAGLVLLTGAFLAPLFEPLPQATLGAIVIVAVAGFFRVDELRRFARVRPMACALAALALAGVLAFGVLPGLLIAAALSLGLLVHRLSRPAAAVLARDPATGSWGRAERHPDWERPPGVVVVRVDGPLFYGNATVTKDHVLALVRAEEPAPRAVVLELDQSEIDLAALDMLAELAQALGAAELRLAEVRVPVAAMLARSGLTERVPIEPTLDAAVGPRPAQAPPG